ncbi:ribonuclease H2 subunit C isoform X2 [Camarhynchus parvulus]|uniref:ribonuclease H2 subunit C isoform X2 n=1 Tax=Geospiza parvula TaxID=87175 RepID=UPI001237C8E6|nr:ribonuclease H2 subunit C isoform X2 [Camarhynchus parvulus]
MAAPVRVRVPPGAPPEPLPVQLLPCRIQHDGPAPVAAFLRARPGPDGGRLGDSDRDVRGHHGLGVTAPPPPGGAWPGRCSGDPWPRPSTPP